MGSKRPCPGAHCRSEFQDFSEPVPRSCSHGCGRRLSRDAARRRITPGALEDQLRGVWYDRRRSRQLCDEAPAAYKDIESFLRAQRDLVRANPTATTNSELQRDPMRPLRFASDTRYSRGANHAKVDEVFLSKSPKALLHRNLRRARIPAQTRCVSVG